MADEESIRPGHWLG